jgi:Family of unknown function (DUF6263)
VLRLRYLGLFGLLTAFVVATAVAQDKKEPVKDPKETKVETKKEDPKDPKKEDPKDPKKEDPKKVDPKDPKKEDPKDPKKVDPKDPKKEDPKDPKKEPPKPEIPPLVWKFEAKKSFYQEMKTTTEQNIKVMGLDVVQKQDQTFYFKWTPEELDKDGNWKITQEIEGIKMKIDIAGNPVSFDSTQENPPGGANTALSEFFKALKGSKFTLTFSTKTLKVEKVDGRKEFVDKLATANQQLQPLLSKILSEDALRQMADPTFGILPPAGKKIGDDWQTTTTLNLGPIGTYTNEYKYKWKEQDAKNKDLEVITVDTSLKYTAPTEVDPALPFKIKSSNLTTKKENEPNGKIIFNSKLGRLESSEIKIALSGTLTIEIGGNSTQVELTQNQTTSVATRDETFLPKPPMDPKKP